MLVALWPMAQPESLAAWWMQAGVGAPLVVTPVVFSCTERVAVGEVLTPHEERVAVSDRLGNGMVLNHGALQRHTRYRLDPAGRR